MSPTSTSSLPLIPSIRSPSPASPTPPTSPPPPLPHSPLPTQPPTHPPHRFSILIDPHTTQPPLAESNSDDDAEDEDQPGSLATTPRGRSPAAGPPHLHPPLSPSSLAPHSASFSFSYQSSDDEEEDRGRVVPSVSPPVGSPPVALRAVAVVDRYSGVGEVGGGEGKEGLERVREEEEEDEEEEEEEDITKVISYHTVRKPQLAAALAAGLHFEPNPLAQGGAGQQASHVIDVRDEKEAAVVEVNMEEEDERQRLRREKRERKARRAERRLRRQQRVQQRAMLAQQSANPADMPASPVPDSARSFESSQSRMIALATAGMGAERKESPSVVINVSDVQLDDEEEEKKEAPKDADAPLPATLYPIASASADGKRSLREERRPAKLNIPPRSTKAAASVESKSPSDLASPSSATPSSAKAEQSAEAKSPQPRRGSLLRPTDPVKEKLQAYKTVPKQSLRQLVAVAWLPTEPVFPPSKQSRADAAASAVAEPVIPLPVVSEAVERVARRRERADEVGHEWKARAPWLAAHRWDTRTEIDDDRPSRFKDSAARPGGGGGADARVVGRESVMRLEKAKKAHLYSEVILIDDGRPVDAALLSALNAFTRCTSLTVNDTKVTHTKLHLPSLTQLTLSNNKIASLSTLTHLTQHTPNLTAITLINNPVNSKLPPSHSLPPVDHDIWRLCLLPLQSLRFFNSAPIDPPSRYAAFTYAKQPKLRGSVSMALWDAALNEEPTVLAMGGRWDPLRVKEIRLKGQSLLALHCSPLAACVGLTSLNVSGNHLTSLQHSGLHLLPGLTHLDVSDNELHAAADCVVFGHLPALRSLVMKGNEGWKEGDARLYAVYCCRWLKGTQTAPGLHHLDGEVVSAAEKVRAVEKYEKADAGYERWRVLCAATYTQTEWLHQPTHITVLSLPSSSLTFATVVSLTSLLSIDLSHNALTFIDGLDALPSLRFIDLSHNPDLNLRTTLHQLSALHSLEAVHCLPSDSTHRSDHHQRVVTALFPSNPRLAVVDGRRVDVSDYVAAMKRLNAFAGKEELLKEYTTHLHILSDQPTRTAKSYAIDAVKPGVQWQAADVAELQLPGLALDECASLISFRSLTFLNLSHNRLLSLSGLHLPSLPALKWVDLRCNRLKDTPLVFAGLLTQCRQLRGVMVAGNPCAGEKRWRAKVIDHLPALITVDSQLQLLDHPISIDERVTAYTNSLSHASEPPSPSPRSPTLSRQATSTSIFSSSSNHPPSKLSDADTLRVAQFRFLLCLQYNLPQSASFHLVKELILVDQRLSFIDFRPFPSLQKLFLGRNELTTLQRSNIDACKQLRVLDVRSNRLRELAEVIDLIAMLPALEYVGARDNKFKEGAKYRNHLILGMVSKVGHGHCIRFIDDSEIGADEVVTSLVETGEIHSVREREVFRFNELIKHKDCQQVVDLNLSNCKLQAAEFHRFPHLQRLHIAGNAFTDEALLASGLDACEELVELAVQDNALRHTQKVASYTALMPRLASIHVGGNPLMSKEDRPRRLFLSFYPTLLDPTFILRQLNGEAVTIEERINAFVLAGTREKDRNPAKRRTRSMSGSVDGLSPMSPSGRRVSAVEDRGSLTGDPQSPSPMPLSPGVGGGGALQLLASPYSNPAYALSNPLHFTAEAARFTLTLLTLTPPPSPTTTSLKLKSLSLMYIGGPSGILRFQALRQLDLRNNDIETLEAQGLDGLPHLHTLDLRGNRMHSVQAIVAGLHACHHLQVLALHRSTRDSSETAVVDRYLDYVFTNLRGLSLCDGYKAANSLQSSPLSLSALNLLHKLAGIGPNQLHEVHLTGVRGRKELLPLVLSALYHLQVPRMRLDGDNEWCMAAEYTDTVIILMGKHLVWLDGVDMSEERRYLALQVNEKKKLDKDRLAWDEVWEEAHEKVDAFLKEQSGMQRSSREAKEDQARFFNADIPQLLSVETGAATVGSSALMTQGSSALSSLLSKVEIIIHFLQVYAINLTQDIHIPWPHLYLDFSSFTSIFSLSFTDLFSLSSDFAQTLLFALLVVFPMLLLAFFWWFAQLRKKQDYYAKKLIDQWQRTRAVALALYLLSLVVAIAVGIFAAGGGVGLTAMQEGLVPPAESLTVVFLLCCAFTLLFLIWYGIVRKFRRLYTADLSEDKIDFRTKWLSMLNWAQILVMFGLTILFMPIARILLSQFVCACSTDATTGDSVCVDQNYPSQACFPSHVSGVQAFAFVFGLVYIVGLPLFYIRLINRTVKLVLSTSRSYQLNATRIERMKEEWTAYCQQWKADEKGWSAVQRKKMTKEWHAHSRQYHVNLRALARAQHGIYYSVVNQPENTVPASSLYTSFTYRYRFWKIIQMGEKLVLIIIALFVPAVWGLLQQAKVVASGVVIGTTAALVISARPYNDLLEDVMDGMAGVSNLINAGVAIALVYELEWLTSDRADIILLVANGATLGAFVIAFTVVPLRALNHAKRDREKEQKEQEGKDKERQEREAKREKREKDKAKDVERTQAMRKGGGAVAMVSAEEFKEAQEREQGGGGSGHTLAYPVAVSGRGSRSSLSLERQGSMGSLVRAGPSSSMSPPPTSSPMPEQTLQSPSQLPLMERGVSGSPVSPHRSSLSVSQGPRAVHSRSASRRAESLVLPAIVEVGGDGTDATSPSVLSPYAGTQEPLSPLSPKGAVVGGSRLGQQQVHKRHVRAVSVDERGREVQGGKAVSMGGVGGGGGGEEVGRRVSVTADSSRAAVSEARVSTQRTRLPRSSAARTCAACPSTQHPPHHPRAARASPSDPPCSHGTSYTTHAAARSISWAVAHRRRHPPRAAAASPRGAPPPPLCAAPSCALSSCRVRRC